jgi:hypothetical protein
MAQSIEEQIEIMKAYADGKPVYRTDRFKEVGEQVEAKGHQFNFERSFYSLTPLDWCTGKEAIDAYYLFCRHGSDKDPAPPTYNVTSHTTERMTNKTLEYTKTAMDFVDTYIIFIAGAEWVLKNKGTEIDFEKSLQVLREKYKQRSEEQDYRERHALESY